MSGDEERVHVLHPSGQACETAPTERRGPPGGSPGVSCDDPQRGARSSPSGPSCSGSVAQRAVKVRSEGVSSTFSRWGVSRNTTSTRTPSSPEAPAVAATAPIEHCPPRPVRSAERAP
jgi:hypothetical protein